MSRVVFDIGGTYMRVAKVEEDSLGPVLKKETPPTAEAGTLLLVDLIKQAAGENLDLVVGGIAGVIGKDGTVYNSPNLSGWNGTKLGQILEENITEQALVYNDCDLAALGESRFGAGIGASVFVYVGIGTGVGGGRVIGGMMDEYNFGFEPGHQVIDVQNRKILEDYVSGRAIQKNYGKLLGELDRSVYNQLVSYLAVGLHNIILLSSPEKIALGGPLIDDKMGYKLEDIIEELGKLPQLFPSLPKIVRSELGDNAVLFGAKALME